MYPVQTKKLCRLSNPSGSSRHSRSPPTILGSLARLRQGVWHTQPPQYPRPDAEAWSEAQSGRVYRTAQAHHIKVRKLRQRRKTKKAYESPGFGQIVGRMSVRCDEVYRDGHPYSVCHRGNNSALSPRLSGAILRQDGSYVRGIHHLRRGWNSRGELDPQGYSGIHFQQQSGEGNTANPRQNRANATGTGWTVSSWTWEYA
ncbi:hypothetical protein B0H13DRAFT_1934780 [Mycena leptocephala]|nr:hypothetical protein B0H13DRAFT_1934780 [Mycena leptocephala]